MRLTEGLKRNSDAGCAYLRGCSLARSSVPKFGLKGCSNKHCLQIVEDSIFGDLLNPRVL